MTKIMKIDFISTTNGKGTLTYNGFTYNVLGKSGYKYPKDSTITTNDKEKNHYSQEFKCNLPWAIKLDGTKGIYIHQDITSGNLSHGNSHGCINLLPGDAQHLFNNFTEKTRVLITYPW